MKIVTHNTLVTLNPSHAAVVVKIALSSNPQIAGFQEWNPSNNSVLRNRGDFVREKQKAIPGVSDGMYFVCIGASGLPVLVRKSYAHSVPTVKQLHIADDFVAPAHRSTVATEVRFMNRNGLSIAVLNTHPVAHLDRPEFKAAHKQAVDNIEAWISKTLSLDHIPFVLMDGNGLPDLKRLVSCWEGQKMLPTGPGGHTIDGVWANKLSKSVQTFKTPSDHNGVLAQYDRF